MNQPSSDPLNDYFTSEWIVSLSQEPHASSDFSAAVLKKIVANRCKERLFNLACLSIAFFGIAATVVFVYPGYKQLLLINWQEMATKLFLPFSHFAHGLGNALEELFILPLRQPETVFMMELFIYLVLLAATLWGVDSFLRKRYTTRH